MLPVEFVSDLRLHAPTGAAERHRIAAASALAIVNETVYVVSDDELYVGIFPDMGRSEGHPVPLLRGRLPRDDGDRAGAKPDLESLTPLPAFARFSTAGSSH